MPAHEVQIAMTQANVVNDIPRADPFASLAGTSQRMQRLKEQLLKVARSSTSTVLLTGETGTGKSFAARAIHEASYRAQAPFVHITCCALPPSLLESELFGHERGAFTDAKEQHKGILERAEGGTLFLDEIGEMTVGLQAKLLGFLEERSFRRLGGTKDIATDIRIIAATHRDLRHAVTSGEFREDLFYRLNVIPVHIPALRDHPEDIDMIVDRMIVQLNSKLKTQIASITPQARLNLRAYSWPGNVRELRNVVERAMLLSDGRSVLTAHDFDLHEPVLAASPTDFLLPTHGVDLEKVECSLVMQAVLREHGNQSRAARLLGLNRDQVRYRIEKFGLWELVNQASTQKN